MPVRAEPEALRAVIAWEPGLFRPVPVGWMVCQVRPLVVHQTTTCWLPGLPSVPTATMPLAAEVRAVTVDGPRRTVSGSCCQRVPPSVLYSANAEVPVLL